MVKEYDEGQKGAEWLAIVPITSKELPACVVSRETGDKLLGKGVGGDDWCGYFWGANYSSHICAWSKRVVICEPMRLLVGTASGRS